MGMRTLIDKKHKIAHNKIVIIDDATLITGSFNFIANAEENGEHLLVIRDMPALLEKYVKKFAEHEAHSDVCVPPAVPTKSTPANKTPVAANTKVPK